ncbi:MAG: hypothetical protein LBQ98_09760 [Nitrososphaerota archaeon]|jgi:hypothetical protein|nr:hypothetical protein [Nitrososphaerota archaeon]
MGTEQKRTLLTIGIFFLAVTIAILLYVIGIINWILIVPVVAVFCGLWLIVLGVMRTNKLERYERSSFSTVVFGLITLAVGGAWAVFAINWIYSVIVILLIIVVIAIATAFQHK